jgi:hypothetical protein
VTYVKIYKKVIVKTMNQSRGILEILGS